MLYFLLMFVYGKCECFVMQILYVCVLCASCGSSQCCVLYDLQFVNASRRCKKRPYGRGILQVPKKYNLHDVGILQTSAQIVSTQLLPPVTSSRFRLLGKPSVDPCRMAGSAPHKSGGHRVKSWPDDTNKHSLPALTPVIWICDVCHKQINKQKPSIRCNRTHWIHLKCTHKTTTNKADWGCTIHTPTQLVTTTPSTANTTAHHQQITTHSQTTITQKTKDRHNSNQHERHQKQYQGTKKTRTQHPTRHHHNTRN